MADLTADDVTVSIGSRDKDFARIGSLKNLSIASIAFGDGVLTYPTGGVPLPAIGHFGLNKQMDLLIPQQPSDNGFIYKYDATNHTLLIYTQGVVTGSTSVSPSGVGAKIENSASSAGNPELVGASPDLTYDFGPLIELPTTITPAAVTIKALVVGE